MSAASSLPVSIAARDKHLGGEEMQRLASRPRAQIIVWQLMVNWRATQKFRMALADDTRTTKSINDGSADVRYTPKSGHRLARS
jgi:hypothetical protein